MATPLPQDSKTTTMFVLSLGFGMIGLFLARGNRLAFVVIAVLFCIVQIAMWRQIAAANRK